MANNNNDTNFKSDELVALELVYIRLIGRWLMYAKENRTCDNPSNSKHALEQMLRDFFIEPKFALFKSQALYKTLNCVLKQPFINWKIADEEWFTQLDTHYKKLLLNSKLQQIEGDFTNE